MGIVGDTRALVVGIEQRQVERFRKIDRKKAHRQEILRRVRVTCFRGGTGFALLGNRREAVVGRDHDVGGGGETEIVERFAQLRQIVVGILDGGERGRAVDAGRQGVEAVAGIVLGAVGIARPEHQHERFAARLEHRQHDLAGDVGEISLLVGIRNQRARRLGVAGLAVVAARGCYARKARLLQRGFHFVRKRHAVLGAGGIVDHDRMQAGSVGAVGVVENQRWADLADCRGAEPLRARQLQDGLFIEVIATEMLVDIAQHCIVFDEGGDGIAGGRRAVTGEDRVAESPGVAEKMPGRHARGVGHGEGRKQRMRVLEIDALVADFGHRWRGLGRDLQRAQSIRNEQDHIVGSVVLRGRHPSGQ